jgi:hypothetical protein
MTLTNNGTIGVISGSPTTTTPNLTITTSKGKITANLETGDLTLPHGVGKDEGLREFWLGFQEHFKPTVTLNPPSSPDISKLEQEINNLKAALDSVNYAKMEAEKQSIEAKKIAANHIADKVRKKYNKEKFIMVKPEDLIKFIEDEK